MIMTDRHTETMADVDNLDTDATEVPKRPGMPVTRLVRAGKRFIQSYWETQTLSKLQMYTIPIFIMDLAMSVLILIMLFAILDISQAFLTLWQIPHIYTWLLMLTCRDSYDLWWVTFVLVLYIIAIIADFISFVWRIVDLIDDGLNTFFLVTLGIQTAANGVLIIVDVMAIVVLSLMRMQLFPKIVVVTKMDQIRMWQAWAGNISIVQAARERFHNIQEFANIWYNLEEQEQKMRGRRSRSRRGRERRRKPKDVVLRVNNNNNNSNNGNRSIQSPPPPPPPRQPSPPVVQPQSSFRREMEELHYHYTPISHVPAPGETNLRYQNV